MYIVNTYPGNLFSWNYDGNNRYWIAFTANGFTVQGTVGGATPGPYTKITSQSFTVPIPKSTWFHFAVCGSGGTAKTSNNNTTPIIVDNNQSFYINGTYVGGITAASSSIGLYLCQSDGNTNTGSSDMYIYNVRITKGVQLYTKRFFPKFVYSPLTSGTVLCQTCVTSGTTTQIYDVANNTYISRWGTGGPFGYNTFITPYYNGCNNINFDKNIFRKNYVLFKDISINTLNFTNNIFLSSYAYSLNMNSTKIYNSYFYNNNDICPISGGSYLLNNSITGSYGALTYNSPTNGMYVSGSNSGNIVGGSINSTKEGVYVDASTGNLSTTNFKNIITNNNSSVGFRVSGNNTSIYLNLTGLTASNNTSNGFEAYNVIGNVNSLITNTNSAYGIRVSLNGLSLMTNITSNNNLSGGVIIDSTTNNLSTTLFQNIITNSNSSVGFKVSGNSLNYLTPVVLNINALTASNNLNSGFEAYNITGNISGVVANNNYLNGIKTSIGNGPTIFDGLTVLNPSYNSSILSSAYTTTGTPTVSSNAPFNGFNAISFSKDTYNIAIPSPSPTLGTSDFTIEFWLYLTDKATSVFIFGQHSNTANTWAIGLNGLGFVEGTSPSFTRTSATFSTTPLLSTWYHFAFVRKNTVVTAFLNGVSGTSLTNGVNLNNTGVLQLGWNPASNTEWTAGYISNLRILKTALYTTNFTPPSTSKLLAIPNTIALINDYNGYYTYSNTSTASGSVGAMNILSGYNYSQTVIKNALLSANTSIDPALSAAFGLTIDSTRFGEFSLNNSILNSTIAMQFNTTRNLLEGSYLFNNSILGATPLGASGITNIYQPYTTKNTGFAFTNLNKIAGNNVSYYAHGSIYLDSTIFADTSASERLVPNTTTAKLKSASKFVALNTGDYTSVVTYVRKSTLSGGDSADYNGSSPRLILKRNPSMGINNDIVLATLDYYSTAFEKLNGLTPVVTDNGVLEFYVDCDGTQGWINVDSWLAT
jgi:hypothetical protein